MTVKGQISTLVVVLCILIIFVGVHGIYVSSSIRDTYQTMLSTSNQRNLLANQMDSASNDCQQEFYFMGVISLVYNDVDSTKESYNNLQAKIDYFYSLTDKYLDVVNNDKSVDAETRQKLENFQATVVADVDEISEHSKDYYEACLSNNKEMIDSAGATIVETFEQTDADIKNMVDIAELRSAEAMERAKSETVVAITITTISLIVCIVIGAVLSAIISKVITEPLKRVTDASSELANGNLDVDTKTNLSNEVGQLSNNFAILIDTFKAILGDMHEAFKKMNKGDLDARIDETGYTGSYKVLVDDINQLLENTGSELAVIIESVNEYSNGNFEYTAPRFPGKKATLHEAMDSMKHQLQHISETVTHIISKIGDGDLNVDISTEGFNGDWEVLALKLRELVSTVAKPIRVTKEALGQIASANFSYRIDVDEYKGEFREMAEDINKTTSILSEDIVEISTTLTRMANQDLDVSITKEYIGDFSAIRESLELIIKNFNKLIEEIMLSSEQVALGSNSIADSSTSLAQGASQQASAVEQLTATIGSVADNTENNTNLVLESNEIAIDAKHSVEIVKREMDDLLESMREINESSNNISAVLQVIDDIAFQTNILALNAAVEAARAGEQGKGFAIVAEEVRNLAARSQEAAKNSSDLIEVSVAKAEHGSMIADRTAETINAVTEQIEKISEISSNVAESSKEQNKSIGEINIGIKQISEVVSTNTATSEESAAASQELASQSAVFKEMISKFKLKNRRARKLG
jgi:methyl-accepting chemotaxis protein